MKKAKSKPKRRSPRIADCRPLKTKLTLCAASGCIEYAAVCWEPSGVCILLCNSHWEQIATRLGEDT